LKAERSLYSRFITYLYQGASGRGAADTSGAEATGQGQRGRRGCGSVRMRSRGVGRESGGPSFSLSAARPPSLLAFLQGSRPSPVPFPLAVGGRGGRAGAATRAQRGGGAEAGTRTGATGSKRKVGHDHQQQETGIGVSCGRSWPSHGWVEASAAAGPDSCVGSQRPRWPSSSFPPALLRTAPSPHPSLAPLRVAARGDEDSAAAPSGGGGAGRWPGATLGAEAQHRWLHSTRSAPLRTDGAGAPLSTFAVPAGPQRSFFVSAPCSGAGGCSRSGGGGAG